MSLSQNEISKVVLAQVPEARRAQSVVYLYEDTRPADSEIEIDFKKVRLDAPVKIGFIDLEPELNWGHACRYVLVDTETGKHRNIDAHFPPFLRQPASDLIVLFKGDQVPDWAIKKSNQNTPS